MMQLHYPKIIFSHEAALYLNGMAEREPDPVSVTVPSGYHSSKMESSDIKVYRVAKDKFELGLTERETPTGSIVRCYNLERTLCDMLRSRNSLTGRVTGKQSGIARFAAVRYMKESAISIAATKDALLFCGRKTAIFLP